MKDYISEKLIKISLLLLFDFLLLICCAWSKAKKAVAPNKTALHDLFNQTWCSFSSVEHLPLDPTLRYTHRNSVLMPGGKRKRQKPISAYLHTHGIYRDVLHTRPKLSESTENWHASRWVKFLAFPRMAASGWQQYSATKLMTDYFWIWSSKKNEQQKIEKEQQRQFYLFLWYVILPHTKNQ